MKKHIWGSILLTTFIMLLLGGCSILSKKYKPYTGLSPYFSISSDDNKIAFAYFIDDHASIYIADIDGTNIRRLTYANENISHSDPAFSPDGKKILFRTRFLDNDEMKAVFSMMNVDGTNIKQITNKGMYVTEGTFSPDGEKIYFLVSDYFGSYSPIAQPHRHDYDIYSMNADGSDIKRITSYDAFSMSGLSVSSDSKYLFYKIEKYEHPYSICKMNIENTDDITPIIPEKIYISKYIYDPVISLNEKTLGFIGAKKGSVNGFEYEIFLMNLEDGKTRLLTDLEDSHVDYYKFMNYQETILLINDKNWPRSPEKLILMSINLDGTDLKEIKLDMSKFLNESEMGK